MRETEITVQVFETLEDIENKLKKLGYFLKEKFKLNSFYYSKYPISQLLKMSYIEIIKNSILLGEQIGDGESLYMIFKDKEINQNGDVVSEQKIKTKISDISCARKIFENAGLTNWCNTENNSFIYSNGENEFAVQNIKELGIFIEFEENEKMKNLTAEEKIGFLKETIKGLGLKIGSDFSCKKVYMKFLKDNKNF